MSQTETHIGKLRKVELKENQSLEDWCKEYCNSIGISEISSYNDTWKDQIRSSVRDKFFFVGETVWEAFEHKELDGEDIDFFTKQDDGTFLFVTQFYNGGTCLSEIMEENIEKALNS